MMGAQEFINSKERYCLWLVDCPLDELFAMPLVMDRVEACRQARIKANTPESLKLANTPTLFREQLNPNSYLLLPCVSSEKRTYIPMGFLDKNVIPVMGTLIIPEADLYDFGVLTSSVHMAWTRAVCGRLKSDYRYSKDVVYNNFVWPKVTESQKEHVKLTAQKILEVRDKYRDKLSLAKMYDAKNMLYLKDLVEAHEANDKAVMEAYGFSPRMSEEDIVAALFRLYEQKVAKLQN